MPQTEDSIRAIKGITAKLPGLKILVIDDEASITKNLKTDLDALGFVVIECNLPSQAFGLIETHQSMLAGIISDLKMPEITGFEIRKFALDRFSHIPFAVYSGYIDREMALQGVALKICAFIDKPTSTDALIALIQEEFLNRANSIIEDHELLKGFTDDASALLEQLEPLILGLEENPSDLEAINRIFGMIHTIKGSSGFLQPDTLYRFTHSFEDVLKKIQSGNREVTPELISVMLLSIDTLRILIGEFKSGIHLVRDLKEMVKVFDVAETKTATTEKSKTAQPQQDRAVHTGPTNTTPEVKVSVGILNEFLQISSEITVIRNMIIKVVQSLERRHPTDKDVGYLSELLEEMHKINGTLQNKMTDIRKMPVKTVLKSIPRIIRDTSRTLKKDITFESEGDELRVDAAIAEVLSNSMTHLVRNSMDHGIQATGVIKVECKAEGEKVLVAISDNGRGIDPNVIKNKLIKNGTHTAEQLESFTENQLFQMIFFPGFSTADKITDISGRGVGMSMVKDSVERLGGTIDIHSILGKGTKFTLNLPIPKSVNIINSLFVTHQNHDYGIAQDHVIRILHVTDVASDPRFRVLEGAVVLTVDDTIIPLISLGGVLMDAPVNEHKILDRKSDFTVIWVRSSDHTDYGIVVDSVKDVEDSVVKSIPQTLKLLNIYGGATFLGDASVGLLMSVDGVARKYNLHSRFSGSEQKTTASNSPTHNIITFASGEQKSYGILRDDVFRFEEFETAAIKKTARGYSIPYRNSILYLIDTGSILGNKAAIDPSQPRISSIVISIDSYWVGLVVDHIEDLIKIDGAIIPMLSPDQKLRGSLLTADKTLTILNPTGLIKEILKKVTSNQGLSTVTDIEPKAAA